MLLSAAYPNLFSHVVLIESLGPIGVPPSNHTEHLRDYVKRQRQIHGAGSSRKPLYSSIEEAAVIRATKGIVPLTIEASRLLANRGLEEVETPSGKKWTWRSDVKLTLRPPFRWNEDAVLAYFDAFTWVGTKTVAIWAPECSDFCFCPTYRAPTLVVIGTSSPFFLTMDDDPVFTKRIEAINRHGGACKIAKLAGSHHPHLEPESKDAVAKVIREFVFGV